MFWVETSLVVLFHVSHRLRQPVFDISQVMRNVGPIDASMRSGEPKMLPFTLPPKVMVQWKITQNERKLILENTPIFH